MRDGQGWDVDGLTVALAEAEAVIEGLTYENERLRAELDNCKGGGAYRDEVGSLTSENERLRAAVQAVRDLPRHDLIQPPVVLAADIDRALDAALGGERDE